MITSQQMRAARALLGIDQRQLAELAGLSAPTIRWLVGAGRGVRLREPTSGAARGT